VDSEGESVELLSRIDVNVAEYRVFVNTGAWYGGAIGADAPGSRGKGGLKNGQQNEYFT
jgi:hypothetical protein